MFTSRFSGRFPPIILSIIALVLGMSACLVSLVDAYQTSPFATQSWAAFDPWACTTDWYPYNFAMTNSRGQDLATALRDSVENLEHNMELVHTDGGSSGHGLCYQETPPNFALIGLSINAPEIALKNDVLLGHQIRQIISILAEFPYIQPNTVLTVNFQTSGGQNVAKTWRFQYGQALEALHAGLDGRDMLAIGQ